MEKTDLVIAVFDDHETAEAAIKKLTAQGFETKNLSVVGKGSPVDEKAAGFYSTGERIEFWGLRGAFWGSLWGLFAGGLLLSVPLAGEVVVLGQLATVAVAAIEGAAVAGGIGALGAGLLYYLGIPEDSIVQYEDAVEEGHFLVMAHDGAEAVTRAQAILNTLNPLHLAVHEGVSLENRNAALKRQDEDGRSAA
ncbi:MAG: DUF1269 domain-containing protein [Alphaproteobacteria bacterium]|nr:DUF1269 domain-containing protein [Alphaproteobacteria bacterium]